MDESRIDDLYRGPLAEFTTMRRALAKTLRGGDARRVGKLPKPLLVPWTVNQVYWKAGAVYERLLKSGARLREAELAAMQGHSADIRAASDAHRRAVSDAVKAARRLTAASGPSPAQDAVVRMFEAVSLAASPPEPHGRFTRALQPAGFEAFAGVTARVLPVRPKAGSAQERPKEPRRHPSPSEQAAVHEAERHRAALEKAEAALERARAAEATARRMWERAKRELEAAEQAVGGLRS